MYEIGQVVFVVINKKHQIFPMQVVETVTKKTLQGEEIKYCLQAGSDKSTKIMLDQLDGEFFVSAEEARHVLVSRATSQINALIASAEEKAKSWYKLLESDERSIAAKTLITQFEVPKISYIDEQAENEPEDNSVVLPDGRVAKLRLPDNLS